MPDPTLPCGTMQTVLVPAGWHDELLGPGLRAEGRRRFDACRHQLEAQ